MGKDERPGNARAPMPGCAVSVQFRVCDAHGFKRHMISFCEECAHPSAHMMLSCTHER